MFLWSQAGLNGPCAMFKQQNLLPNVQRSFKHVNPQTSKKKRIKKDSKQLGQLS